MVKYVCHGKLGSANWDDVNCQHTLYPSVTVYYRDDGIEGVRPHEDGWVDIVLTTPLCHTSVKAAIEAHIGTAIELVETSVCVAI